MKFNNRTIFTSLLSLLLLGSGVGASLTFIPQEVQAVSADEITHIETQFRDGSIATYIVRKGYTEVYGFKTETGNYEYVKEDNDAELLAHFSITKSHFLQKVGKYAPNSLERVKKTLSSWGF